MASTMKLEIRGTIELMAAITRVKATAWKMAAQYGRRSLRRRVLCSASWFMGVGASGWAA